MITVSKEDYLKAILEAESEGESVISARLADWLKVSAPAVTMALRRLKKDSLVRVLSDGHVRLTAGGRRIARRLTFRHHLIERMLSEIFGMEWWKVHDEAERLEHAVSPDFEAKLLAKLGKDGVCPHGNLSEMESPASRRHRGLTLLADASPGTTYWVRGIYERDRRLLEFLEARGIRPDSKLRLLERNYDQTLTLSTPAGNVALGRAAATRVWVSPSESRPSVKLRPAS
jgi:DtxR family transcriptional regulator, Mn-dependent transcriptional regulator